VDQAQPSPVIVMGFMWEGGLRLAYPVMGRLGLLLSGDVAKLYLIAANRYDGLAAPSFSLFNSARL
jgi:hypothetical protein